MPEQAPQQPLRLVSSQDTGEVEAVKAPDVAPPSLIALPGKTPEDQAAEYAEAAESWEANYGTDDPEDRVMSEEELAAHNANQIAAHDKRNKLRDHVIGATALGAAVFTIFVAPHLKVMKDLTPTDADHGPTPAPLTAKSAKSAQQPSAAASHEEGYTEAELAALPNPKEVQIPAGEGTQYAVQQANPGLLQRDPVTESRVEGYVAEEAAPGPLRAGQFYEVPVIPDEGAPQQQP